ncbi:MAG: general stress protein CsbD [Gammaproteobacteria bacterium]|nr:general stress protein CsbD [Gammaproteobacteria bacterium]
MNWNAVQTDWKQFRTVIQKRWDKLTDAQLDSIAGKREQLAGTLESTYSIGKDETEKQIKEFEERNKDYRPAQAS